MYRDLQMLDVHILVIIWMEYDKFKQNIQHCFLSNNSQLSWKKYMECYVIIWKGRYPLYLDYVYRYFIASSMYKRNKSSRGQSTLIFSYILMQAPRTSHATLVKGAHFKVATEARLILIAHWHSIVKILNNYLKIMKANFVSLLQFRV